MSSHMRVLVFGLSLLAAPVLWEVGKHLDAEVAGGLAAVIVVVVAALYAQSGQPKPPAGARPA